MENLHPDCERAIATKLLVDPSSPTASCPKDRKWLRIDGRSTTKSRI